MPNLRLFTSGLGLTLIAALASTGCAATLTSGGETVEVVQEYSLSECRQITSIDVEARTYRAALIEARNLAADAGANRLVVTYSRIDDEYGADLSAMALTCG